ncbi:hypothetical protein ZWY2020_004664 [Hordeum vulgare]|nr:hypothetical protein ZWY2020_004664 [Hordeum vulgare]
MQQLDVLDYLSDDGGVPGTAGAPLPVEAPVVPDVGYSDHTRWVHMIQFVHAKTHICDTNTKGVHVLIGSVWELFWTWISVGRPRWRWRSGKIAFRTRSEEEILDDGYKWRKYGKKSVKNSPNPRNYYRCSTEGCNVKKRVERDKDDANYVVTMYEGVHNHASPGMIYYAAQDPASGRFFVTGTHHLAP